LRSLTNYRQVRAGLLLLIVSIDLQIHDNPPMGGTPTRKPNKQTAATFGCRLLAGRACQLAPLRRCSP
jgi:hypothetical protein